MLTIRARPTWLSKVHRILIPAAAARRSRPMKDRRPAQPTGPAVADPPKGKPTPPIASERSFAIPSRPLAPERVAPPIPRPHRRRRPHATHAATRRAANFSARRACHQCRAVLVLVLVLSLSSVTDADGDSRARQRPTPNHPTAPAPEPGAPHRACMRVGVEHTVAGWITTHAWVWVHNKLAYP